MLTRRQLLKHSAWLAAFAGCNFNTIANVDAKRKHFKIGACDWSLGKSSDSGAFEIAKQIGRPGAARGVGTAMSRNPLPIIIPCHRVVGVSGSLTGYSAPGGIMSKQWLLLMEGASAKVIKDKR